jgi:hypothetical protein
LLLLALGPPGCATSVAVQPYAATANTYADMQDVKHVTDHGIGVGRFTMARDPAELPIAPGASVETPGGESFATYLRDALVSELKTAGVYSDAAPVTLTGVVEDIRFSRSTGQQGEWHIILTVTSSSGISVQIDERHDSGDGAPEAFMPAVQELIAKLVHEPRFKELVHG